MIHPPALPCRLLVLCCLMLLSAGRALAQGDFPPPRLVVLVSVDQWRFDYLRRFQTGLLEDGILRRIQRQGALFDQCRYEHAFTLTGPGHAVMATGTHPAQHGIIANAWFSRSEEKSLNCVLDRNAEVIGSPSAEGVSPKNLLAPTLGDALKLATGGKAKVFTIGFKDRAATLTAGQLGDGAFWFDKSSGNWVTSRHYRDQLPGYLRNLNGSGLARSFAGKRWSLIHPESSYHSPRPDDSEHERPGAGMRRAFPHVLAPADDRRYLTQMTTSPFGTEFTLLSAMEIVIHEQLGQDEVPDFLAVNLSSPDYVGHAYGPNSLEVEDMFYRTDLQLGEWAKRLDEELGAGRWVLALTADHGVAPIASFAAEQGVPAGKDPLGPLSEVRDRLEFELRAEMEVEGQSRLVQYVESNQVYLHRDHSGLRGERFAQAQRYVKERLLNLPGVAAAATREELLILPEETTGVLGMLRRAFHAARSGDVLFVLAPYHYYGGSSATTHGSPWEYDTHVPLAFLGAGVRGGGYHTSTSPAAIAPTLAALLRIDPPAMCQTSPLYEALHGH